MLRLTLLSLIVALQAVTQAAAADTKSITEAESVFAVYTNDWGLGATDGPHLIVSVWGDGTVVWSKDQLKGGPPYFSAKVKPADVVASVKRLEQIGAFDIPKLKEVKFGPDSQFTTILVRNAGKELEMNSWHELFESNGKVVAAAHGVTSLEGKKLLTALANEPADYLHYRMAWLELRLEAVNLIPKSGEEVAGVPTMDGGKLSWQPKKEK